MATRPNPDAYRWGWGTHPVPPPGRTRWPRPRPQARPHGEVTSLATVLVARAWAMATRATLAYARPAKTARGPLARGPRL